MMESQALKIVRGQIGYDIFISRALAPFARQMVSQVRIYTVNVKVSTSYW